MRHLVATVAVAAVLASGSSKADDDYVVVGGGAQSCGEFGQLYGQNPAVTEQSFYTWAVGFMSGWNMAASWAGTPERNLSAESAAAEMQDLREYCDEHPLATYMEAVEVVFFKLPFDPGN